MSAVLIWEALGSPVVESARRPGSFNNDQFVPELVQVGPDHPSFREGPSFTDASVA